MHQEHVIAIFCNVDDFCKIFEPMWNQSMLEDKSIKRHRSTTLILSEIMTIVLLFPLSGYQDFKTFYKQLILYHLKGFFPKISYSRYMRLLPRITLPLFCYLHSLRGEKTKTSFIDSMQIAVCHNRRIQTHKVFRGLAQRGKTSMGWVYGFKLHFLSNEQGQMLELILTAGNVDDRSVVDKVTQSLQGSLYADRGRGLQLVTKIRKNMENKPMFIKDKLLLKKRGFIESIFSNLKRKFQLVHTRHRSVKNFVVHLLSSLIAYALSPKKPQAKIQAMKFITP